MYLLNINNLISGKCLSAEFNSRNTGLFQVELIAASKEGYIRYRLLLYNCTLPYTL